MVIGKYGGITVQKKPQAIILTQKKRGYELNGQKMVENFQKHIMKKVKLFI